MTAPRFTKEDRARFRLAYVRASQSSEAGYLKERFAQYRALQAEAAAEREEKLRPMKRAK